MGHPTPSKRTALDNSDMHCIVAFAGVSAPWAASALQALRLPHLRALLAAAHARETSDGDADEWSLSAPHEQAWARACGVVAADGEVPLAAALACEAGWESDAAWGRVTPSHWRLGTEQVSLLDPVQLRLDEPSARALFEAARPLFEEAGYALRWWVPTTWLVRHPSLEGLPCASLDRAIGRNVDPWLGADARARPLRRLQSEVQMLWHRHPVNEAREAQGLDAVNSFWLDGCGRWPAGANPQAAVVEQGLRTAGLAGDEAAWRQAFEAMDASRMAELAERARAGEPVDLWLCGERRWCRLRIGGPPSLHRGRLGWARWAGWAARARCVVAAGGREAAHRRALLLLLAGL